MTTTTDYTSAPQQRLLQLVDLLAGHELQGVTLSAIAKALNCNPSVVVRDTFNLQAAGWAERTPDGERWRLAPHVVRISLRHAAAIRAGEQQLQDLMRRFSGI